MAAVNSQKMSKGSKNMSSNVRNRLKSAKISSKDLLCTKSVKNGYGEFDHDGTLRIYTTSRI